MNINLENYEEYFLLYADKELSAAQKKIVEWFVAANPHLQKEFDDILSTVQKPEDLTIDKSFLFKKPSQPFIHTGNYEEKFVQYHDNELSDDERKHVDDFVDGNKGLNDEFILIKTAKLEPDERVQYPDKAALYRRSASVRYMMFVRWSAAAALAGIILWAAAVRFMQTPEDVERVVASAVTGDPAPRAAQAQRPDPSAVLTVEGDPRKHTGSEGVLKPAAASRPMDIDAQKSRNKENIQLAKNEMAEPEHQAVAMQTSEISVALDVNSAAPRIDPKEVVSVLSAPDSEMFATADKHESIAYASYASNDHADDYIFYDIPMENIKKSKVGVLIKKVKRTIDRNNPINRYFNGEEME